MATRTRKIPPPFYLFDPNDTNSNATVDDLLEGVANLLRDKKNIVVLVGAGISTSVGIPDFRSKDKGLYNTLDAHALGLSCPEDLFCIEFFKDDPVPFYKFAANLYYPNASSKPKPVAGTNKIASKRKGVSYCAPSRSSQRIRRKRNEQEQQNAANGGLAQPSDSHKLLALLEQNKKLLRVYTQNIDGLESSAGVSDSKVVYCHGSLKFMSCTKCSKKKVPVDETILATIRQGSVPRCQVAKGGQSESRTRVGNETRAHDSPVQKPFIRNSERTKKRPRSVMTRNYSTDYQDDDPAYTSSSSVCGGVLKPGITFFGETLDHSVGRKIESDQTKADALIVIGTSLSVAPISKVIDYLPKGIPRILINRTIVHPKSHEQHQVESGNMGGEFERNNYVFDAYLLGFCDDVTRALGRQLGFVNHGKGEKVDGKRSGIKYPSDSGRREKPKHHASATGARLIDSNFQNNNDANEWEYCTIPKERIILFPGALANQIDQKEEIHREIAHCDGCSKQIEAGKPIFKCTNCFDYDLCNKCYPKISKVHCNGAHTFRKEI